MRSKRKLNGPQKMICPRCGHEGFVFMLLNRLLNEYDYFCIKCDFEFTRKD